MEAAESIFMKFQKFSEINSSLPTELNCGLVPLAIPEMEVKWGCRRETLIKPQKGHSAHKKTIERHNFGSFE